MEERREGRRKGEKERWRKGGREGGRKFINVRFDFACLSGCKLDHRCLFYQVSLDLLLFP